MGGVERRMTEGDASEGAGASVIEKKKNCSHTGHPVLRNPMLETAVWNLFSVLFDLERLAPPY